jgi:hypothetical protein
VLAIPGLGSWVAGVRGARRHGRRRNRRHGWRLDSGWSIGGRGASLR